MRIVSFRSFVRAVVLSACKVGVLPKLPKLHFPFGFCSQLAAASERDQSEHENAMEWIRREVEVIFKWRNSEPEVNAKCM